LRSIDTSVDIDLRSIDTSEGAANGERASAAAWVLSIQPMLRRGCRRLSPSKMMGAFTYKKIQAKPTYEKGVDWTLQVHNARYPCTTRYWPPPRSQTEKYWGRERNCYRIGRMTHNIYIGECGDMKIQK
jgi:hypothetical protein